MHPLWRQSKLRKVCEANNIHVSGYSPLGGPGNRWGSMAVIEHPVIKSIALKHNATPAQVTRKYIHNLLWLFTLFLRALFKHFFILTSPL